MTRLRRMDNPRAGWTFVESIIVIAIVVVLSGTVATSAVRHVEHARRAAAGAQISAYRIALHAYYLDSGGYPTTSQGLDALWRRPAVAPVPAGWNGPYLERPPRRDPWGHRYEYRVPGPHGLPFEIRSFGADGLPGGAERDADVSSAE